MQFKDKVFIVSGGARDIGKAVCKKLAAEGAKLAINFHSSEEEAVKTLEELVDAGAQAFIMKGDMTQQADVDQLIEKTLAEFGGKIDGVVNVSGGLIARKRLEEMDLDFFNKVIQVNLNTVFLLSKAALPYMAAGSSIVNLASQAGRDGGGGGASAYATAKGAVMTFTRALAKELGPQGIRVNALCPGMIDTTFHDTFTGKEIRGNVAGATPLRREGRPEEVANAVAFLASEEASFINGANVDINGGLLFS